MAMLITLSGHNPLLFSGGLQSTNAADNSVLFQGGDARALVGQMDIRGRGGGARVLSQSHQGTVPLCVTSMSVPAQGRAHVVI